MAYMAAFPSWFKLLDELPVESAYKVIKALMTFATEGIEPGKDGLTLAEKMVYLSCRKDVENSMNRYNSRVEKNRRNGRLGGLAKAEHTRMSMNENGLTPKTRHFRRHFILIC